MSKGLQRDRVFAGLDIGTTKVSCTIGTAGEKEINIIGVGQSPNTGMRQGVVVNIEAVSEAIQKAKEEAEHKTEGYCGRGIPLINTMCKSVRYLDPGNKVEVIYEWHVDH